jgi:hypothetical protein
LSLVCPWISVEKIILTQIFLYTFSFRFFRENSEIQDGYPFHKKIKKGFFHLTISYLCYASEKSMIKLLLNFFTAWVSDLVKFPEKGLSTMAAIWLSTVRVNS